ncbi:MAG TPA: regulatory protein RecX [Casimicrobiaceae bacterium]|jgi:regulatory protein|nr:regulatory protein RecX [Casimicrobiaceae bacterium]
MGSAPVSLRAQAIRLLARREYARADLEQRLIAKGAPRSEVGPVLDELIAQGYLSDARYARATAVQKAGGYSRRSIAEGLKSKGIARTDIERALVEAETDDEKALHALWQRRFGKPPMDEREKARQIRFLQARGFALSAIFKLLRDAVRGAGT